MALWFFFFSLPWIIPYSFIAKGCLPSSLIYVDDLILTKNDPMCCRNFKIYLQQCFKLKDLGELKYFLGIEAARSSQGLFLSQRKYALDILSEGGMLGAKLTAFPMK